MSSLTTRRKFLKSVGALGLASLVPYAMASGQERIRIGTYSNWIPGYDDKFKQLVQQWADENGVRATVDFLPSQQLATIAAEEAEAGSGHDIFSFYVSDAALHADDLVTINDVAEQMGENYGGWTDLGEYLGKSEGDWVALPREYHNYAANFRLDHFEDTLGVGPDVVSDWTWQDLLEAAAELMEAGHPVGMAISPSGDSNDWLLPLLYSFGAKVFDENGKLVIDSYETAAALKYVKELAEYMPDQIYGWDDSGNNTFMLSGNGSFSFNPPSIWAVAKDDRPDIAEQLWHTRTPAGSGGRYRAAVSFSLGIWEFANNVDLCKDLINYLNSAEAHITTVKASQGYNIPLLNDLVNNPDIVKVWEEAGPPVGTQEEYPVRPPEKAVSAGWPSPPRLAAQIYNRHPIPVMFSKAITGDLTIEESIDWAVNELQGYK